MVVSTESGVAKLAQARLYDIRDLISPDGHRHWPPALGLWDDGPSFDERGEAIAKLVEQTVAPDSWRDAGGLLGWVVARDGRLVVRTTWPIHRRVELLLNSLRDVPDPTPTAAPAPASPSTQPGGRP